MVGWLENVRVFSHWRKSYLAAFQRRIKPHQEIIASCLAHAYSWCWNPPPLTDYATHVQYDLNGHSEHFTTLPGVFSQTHIDPATLLLLNTLKDTSLGRVLDFACGAGVITSALHQSAEQLTACDVNPMAIAASNMTFSAGD